jgi:hypothetical protein
MPDYGFNLNLGPQTKPTSLSDMLNLASGAQNLQQNMQLQPLQLQEARQRLEQSQQMNPLLLQQQKQIVGKGNIDLEQAERTNQEIKAMQVFLSNPDNYQTNGVIDDNKLNAAVPKIAPLNGAKFISELTTLGKAQSENQEAINKLSQNEKALVANPLALRGRMGEENPMVYIEDLKRIKEANPNSKGIQRFADLQIKQLEKSKPGKHIAQSAVMGSEALMSAESQYEKFAPKVQTINTGSEIKPVVSTPSIGNVEPSIKAGGGEAIPVQLGPGQRFAPTDRVDLDNDPTAYVYDANGKLLGEQKISAIAQSATTQPQQATDKTTTTPPPVVKPAVVEPAAKAPARLPPGETEETYKAATAIRSRASDQAKALPEQIFNSNKIIEYADKAKTGKGAQTLANLTGGYAGFNGQTATDLSQIGHYMALQTASLAQSAGLNTDAGKSIAGQMAGITEWTPDAIRNTARVNRALATAGNLFHLGVENSFKKTNSAFSARDFQNKWSQVSDIEAIQLYDAIKNGNKNDVKYVVDSLGGPNSDKYKNVLQKIKFMNTVLKGQ